MKNTSTATLFLCLLFCMLTTSCEKTIKFRGEESEPKLVVNAMVDEDTDTIFVRVSRSLFFTDLREVSRGLPNSEVEVWVNGQSIGKAPYLRIYGGDYRQTPYGLSYHTGESLFGIPYKVKPADKVRITVYNSEYGTATAETIIPSRLEILSIEAGSLTQPDDNDVIYDSYFPIKVTFKDNPIESNFYKLSVRQRGYTKYYYEDKVYLNEEMRYIYCKDTHLGITGDFFPNLFFTDKNINGQEYTLEFKMLTNGREVISDETFTDTVFLTIESLSEDYLLYYASKNSEDMLDDIFDIEIFSEPRQIYSNVEGGIGLVCGRSKESHIAFTIKRSSM